MKKHFFIPLFTLLLLSCGKDKKEFDPAGRVWVRLENATGFTLEDAMVNGVNYGNVSGGHVTEYKQMTTLIYGGYCVFRRNGVQSAAGYGMCGTPMPPPFESGYYTFKIEDTGTGFNSLTVIRR